jgi:hypothetical protein
MTAEKKNQVTSKVANKLGDETFMTAGDLRGYMTSMTTANASNEVEAMDRADKARKELIKSLSAEIEITPAKLQEVTTTLLQKLRKAAERGETELMVMRFPCELCTDKGRAINNAEAGWPETLIGRPRQAYEFWRNQLQPAGYRLTAMIVEWPGGLPGDVGFYLGWGAPKR